MIDESINQSVVTPAEYIVVLACLCAWREELENGINGMVGVLHCLRNRSAVGSACGFPSDLFSNVTKHHQFSSMTVKGDGETIRYPDPRDPGFQRILSLAPSILSGASGDDTTNGGVFYADMGSPDYDMDGWLQKNVVERDDIYRRSAQIGSTTYWAKV